ncbi:Rieske 2Fe-2S domain-containing protein [Novosphingobium sp.]|uniref:Rieske 2Fe-2S domain-containing protein n=1 Tax=Novosphingobium sp. TaxID=1874826 RepID=UPI002B49033A|nr:Rieske 2Fe-2S domain-containing protein [Novosphingobium sp.]HKR92753.1 Rieske 2Fe-2S domain-containing protein [Novosphingobium sp.]
MLEHLMHRVATAVVDDPETGLFRCRRDVFTDPELFELEMKYIFEGNWVYLAHESQVANKNDYYTTWIGRVPVILTRGKDGEIGCVVNACAHRGAKLCRRKRGNVPLFVCPFHGWSFKTDGTLLRAKDASTGAYPDSFDHEGSHDLTRVRIENYRGFLFGSMNPDVAPLEDYLGETRVIIDQIVDQAPEGIEVLVGNSSYTFDGNWKMQMENGCDGYHVSSVHANYAQTMSRRVEGGTKAVDANGWSKAVSGVYGFDNGHILLWTRVLNPEVRPVWDHKAELEARLGTEKAGFIVEQSRNLALYPNVFLMDQFSTQIRVVRPIDVHRTEVTIYCFAPKGESAESRAHRIRQYEDFFNVSGMGTPDDLEEFRSCQAAYEGAGELWNDLSRGAVRWIAGPDENAKAMGMNPLLSSERSEDEGLFVRQHEYWAKAMLEGMEHDREALSYLEAAE